MGNVKVMLSMFKIESNRIKMDPIIKTFNHHIFAPHYCPLTLYLRHNKLWFVRVVDHYIRPAPTPQMLRNGPITPPDPSNNNCRISYFDLEEKHPLEIHVGTITVEMRSEMHTPEGLFNLQWVGDSLLVQLTTNTLGRFDLLNYEWLTPIELRYI
jgi:hypothetical protein